MLPYIVGRFDIERKTLGKTTKNRLVDYYCFALVCKKGIARKKESNSSSIKTRMKPGKASVLFSCRNS